jgi:succinoglycan biosynthesis protein ExoL
VKNEKYRILCFLPVLGQPRHAKRIAMLKQSGFNVEAVAFERDYHKGRLPECPTQLLGKISQGQYLTRIFRLITVIPKVRRVIKNNDLVYAFGLDMALVSIVAGLGMTKPVILEVGDIRKIQSSKNVIGGLVRIVDRLVVNRCKLLVVTAQGFVDGYYRKTLSIQTPTMVIENKLEAIDTAGTIIKLSKESPFINRPLRIGYFGLLRCEWSWRVLEAWAVSRPNDIEIEVAGFPVSPKNIPERAKSLANVNFLGEYRSPDDLPALYRNVDLVWGCYPYTDSDDLNFPLALSNRLYEACYYQRPIINRIGSGNGNLAEQLGIGIGVGGTVENAIAILNNISRKDMELWRKNIQELPPSIYEYTTEAKDLKQKICSILA